MENDRILMAHGSGGLMSQQLIEEVFKKAWNNSFLNEMLDGALFDLPPGRVAMTTDSFVITPLFFPGGDIGKLSICGTVNDLVACGAQPLFLSTAFIIEEGLPLTDLRKIVASMAVTAEEAGVKLVTGDTKVVEKGSADGIFINTTGVGVIPDGIDYRPSCIKPGDTIIVTGPVGDHGLAILAQREGLRLATPALSDCAPLNMIGRVLTRFGPSVRCLRDPTRGGLATVLNELAVQSGLGLVVDGNKIPVSPIVQGACDLLGLDPLHMANEGKLVIISSPEDTSQIVASLRQLPMAAGTVVIGEVESAAAGMVLLQTELGSRRILGILEGEHLPRIC